MTFEHYLWVGAFFGGGTLLALWVHDLIEVGPRMLIEMTVEDLAPAIMMIVVCIGLGLVWPIYALSLLIGINDWMKNRWR